MPLKDPDKRRAYNTTYRAAHPELGRASNAAWHATHREERRASATAYYAAHHEERGTYLAAYRATHREELRIKARAWGTAHREERRVYDAARRQATPEKWREYAHRRRTRLRSQFIAPVDPIAIYRRDRGRCHLCGKHVKRVDASMDHLRPISLGGVHAPYNVSLAHLKCNLRRGTRGPAQLLLAME